MTTQPTVSLEAIANADLPKMLMMILQRLAKLEADVAELREAEHGERLAYLLVTVAGGRHGRILTCGNPCQNTSVNSSICGGSW